MTLEERNEEINKSLVGSLEQLNAVIEQQEKMLKSMMIARDTVHCFHSYQEENDDRGDYEHLVGMIKFKGGWRLCYAFNYDDYAHPDRPVPWKPLVDCSIEDRIRAAPHVEKLRDEIVAEKETILPEVANAIKTLASIKE